MNEIVKKSLKGKKTKKIILSGNKKNASNEDNKNEEERPVKDGKIDSKMQGQVLTARDVSMILYGLQGYQSEDSGKI